MYDYRQYYHYYRFYSFFYFSFFLSFFIIITIFFYLQILFLKIYIFSQLEIRSKTRGQTSQSASGRQISSFDNPYERSIFPSLEALTHGDLALKRGCQSRDIDTGVALWHFKQEIEISILDLVLCVCLR